MGHLGNYKPDWKPHIDKDIKRDGDRLEWETVTHEITGATVFIPPHLYDSGINTAKKYFAYCLKLINGRLDGE